MKGISATEIRNLTQSIKAQKQIIILDACQSGGAVETFARRGAAEEKAIVQLARSSGAVLLASTGTEPTDTVSHSFLMATRIGDCLRSRNWRASMSRGLRARTRFEMESSFPAGSRGARQRPAQPWPCASISTLNGGTRLPSILRTSAGLCVCVIPWASPARQSRGKPYSYFLWLTVRSSSVLLKLDGASQLGTEEVAERSGVTCAMVGVVPEAAFSSDHRVTLDEATGDRIRPGHYGGEGG